MKRLATLVLLATLAFAAHAETVLICHAQSVPAALGKTFQSPLSAAVLDGVFDYFFSKGDIAFDTPFSLADGVPSSAWLAGLSNRYGADKVVYVQVLWKQGPDDSAILDRVDYQVVAPRGNVLAEGSFSLELTTGTKEEPKQVKAITARVVAGLAS
jgi:hypothetical protein